MKKTIVSALITFLTFSAFSQTLPDAQREIDNENYFRAKQILFKLLNDPEQNKAEVAYYLGNTLLKSEDPDSAKLFYKMAYNPDTRSALGYVANGRLALLSKNKAEAKTNFDRALQTSKMKNATIYYEIGDAYFRPVIMDLQTAITYFEGAYNLDNKNTTIMLSLGDAYLENSVNDNTMGGKAMNKYEAAADLNKNLALAWIKIGRLSMRGRIYDQAIDAFNKALAIDQKYPLVYKELAEAYYLTRQYDKVKPNFEKYIALSPGDNQARTTLASLNFQSKDYDKAIEESTIGLKNDSSNYIFQRVLAFSNYELKRYKEASEAIKRFWELPNKKVKDADIIYSAHIAAAVGDTALAMDYFRKALANDSDNCDMMTEFAKVLFQSQRYEDAISQYKLANDKCGRLGSVEIYYLGRSYYTLKDSAMADTTFAEFIARNPGSPDGYYWRAHTLSRFMFAKNDKDFPATPFYQKYVELTSTDPARYKRNLIEAYDYLGASSFDQDKKQSKEYFMKAIELDPADEFALLYLKSF
ncbi:MAG: tetratricopeptide repeat protein [Bacteroidetes bacterium]|nr:tetratricopeptide repeat protein [Bacteroidota bacterium]